VSVAAHVEPRPLVETGRIDHEDITLPFASRITAPGRLRIFGKRPAIRVDLAEGVFDFEQHQRHAWRLLDTKGYSKNKRSRQTKRKTARVGMFFGTAADSAVAQGGGGFGA